MNTQIRIGTFSAVLFSVLTGCAGGDFDADGLVEADLGPEIGESAQALSPCYGGTCDNKSPDLCEADATTVASSSFYAGVSTGKVAIRYSSSCQAAWTRVSLDYGTAFLRAELRRTLPTGGVANTQSASPTPTSAQRSLMLGVTSGAAFLGKGFAGSSYGYYPYSGNVSRNF